MDYYYRKSKRKKTHSCREILRVHYLRHPHDKEENVFLPPRKHIYRHVIMSVLRTLEENYECGQVDGRRRTDTCNTNLP